MTSRRLAAVLLAGSLLGFGIGRASAVGRDDGRHRETIVFERDCYEDEPYLVGRGDFDGHLWARYRCVHVDQVSG